MKNLETGDDLEAVAVHEVGHAIFGAYHGLTIHLVDLYEQMTTFKPPNKLNWQATQELYLAGIAAEAQKGIDIPAVSMQRSQDWQIAVHAQQFTNVSNYDVLETVDKFLAENHEAVETLTALLLAQGYLDNADVQAVFA